MVRRKMTGKFIVIVGVLVFLVGSTQAHESEVDFTYGSSKDGPEHWGSLKPEYKACSAGKIQSPININRSELVLTKGLTNLVREYDIKNASLVDNGYNVMLKWADGAGVLIVNDKNYTLRSLHWHTPSEHTIDGVRYPVELHLVHKSADGNFSVVAILYDYGDADPFYEQLEDPLHKLASEGCSPEEDVEIPTSVVKTRSMSRGTNKYYRYIGSFTTPPCTQNVIWNILGKVRQMSKEQVEMLRAPLGTKYKNNSRPLQPLNGRQVLLYSEDVEN